MAPSGKAPESRPIGGKDLVESGALNSLITDRGQEASSDCARALPFLGWFQQFLANRNLLQNCLVPLLGIIIGEPNIRGVATKVPKVIPDVPRNWLLPVLINGLESIEQGEISLPGRNRGPKQRGLLSFFLRADLHILRKDIPFGNG